MRANSLAKKMQEHKVDVFWKQVKQMNNSKTPQPNNMEGVVGNGNIAKLWENQYSELLNCVRSNIQNVKFDMNSNSTGLTVTCAEIRDAICKLDAGKSCGADKIYAEHLKYAGNRVVPMLAVCLTWLLVHGVLPESMISVILVPVIKDKTGKINSKDNYRPIALASVLSKVLEYIILDRIEMYLVTQDNQYGFKRTHGTDLCIYALKEIIHVMRYRNLNSTVFLCFLDASN